MEKEEQYVNNRVGYRFRIPISRKADLFTIPTSTLQIHNQKTRNGNLDDVSTTKQHLPDHLNNHQEELSRAHDVDQKSCRRVVNHIEYKTDEDAENEDECEFDHLE